MKLCHPQTREHDNYRLASVKFHVQYFYLKDLTLRMLKDEHPQFSPRDEQHMERTNYTRYNSKEIGKKHPL